MLGGKQWEVVEGQGEVFSARTGHSVVSSRQGIFLFGGTDGSSRKNDIHLLIPERDEWVRVEASGKVPEPRSGSQGVLHKDCLYFFGGYTKKDGEYFNDICCFNPEILQWVEVVPSSFEYVPEKRTDHSLVAYHDTLVVFGGFDGSSRYNDLVIFNLATSRWDLVLTEVSPEKRFGHTAVVHKKKMVLFGGWNGHETLNDVWSFNFTTQKWHNLSASGFICPRYRHSAVTMGNSMVVFGGVNKEQKRFNDVYELNMEDFHWSKVETQGNKPTPRTFHRAVTFDGTMYVFGGFDGNRLNDAYRLNLNELSPEDDLESNPLAQTTEIEDDLFEWKQIQVTGPTYSARTGHCAINAGNRFYVFGGTDESNRRNDLYLFDIENSSWRQVVCQGQVPQPRSGAKGVYFSRGIYLFGGYTRKDGNYFNDLYKFDLETCYWSKLFPTGDPPSPRTDHSCVLYENSMYIFAGYDGKNRFNDLRVCNLESFEWKLVEATGNLPIKRFGHTAVVYNHNMYVFGGWDGHETLDDLYQYSFLVGNWNEIRHVVGTRPNPRYRHSCVAYNGSLFIFGGVDKNQFRYNDLHEFCIKEREWLRKNTTGKIPTSRTFHRALIEKDTMYVLGGFDGKRQNDLHCIRLACDDGMLSSRPSTSMIRFLEVDEGAEYQELVKQNYLLKQQVKELSERLEREEERDQCRICYEREINTVLLECAHRVMCNRCAGSFSSCPVCRKDIVRSVVTYTAY